MRKLLSLLLALTFMAGLMCGGASASGEPSGGPSGAPGGNAAITADSSDTETVTLVPVAMDELIIGPEGYEFETDVYCGRVEVDPAAELTSPYPVVVFFDESDTVKNGEVIGNVQFVSTTTRSLPSSTRTTCTAISKWSPMSRALPTA